MVEERLRVVTPAEAEGKARIRREDPARCGPLFFGSGGINLICGVCAFLLMRGMPSGSGCIDAAVVVCPNCGELNAGWGT